MNSPDPGYIYKKGSDVRAAVRKFLVAFGVHYPKVSKNGYEPQTGDPTGVRTWETTETDLYQNRNWGVAPSLHGAVKHILRLHPAVESKGGHCRERRRTRRDCLHRHHPGEREGLFLALASARPGRARGSAGAAAAPLLRWHSSFFERHSINGRTHSPPHWV